MGPNAHRSRSISDVPSFSMGSVLSCYPIRARALCVEEPQLGCISSVFSLEYDVYITCLRFPFVMWMAKLLRSMRQNMLLVRTGHWPAVTQSLHNPNPSYETVI